MVSSVALRAGELAAAALLAGAVLLAVMVAGVSWLRRRVRRRLEVFRLVLASRARGAAASAGGVGPRWLWSLPLPDGRWRGGVRARRELWRAVGAAEHAVAARRPAVAARRPGIWMGCAGGCGGQRAASTGPWPSGSGP